MGLLLCLRDWGNARPPPPGPPIPADASDGRFGVYVGEKEPWMDRSHAPKSDALPPASRALVDRFPQNPLAPAPPLATTPFPGEPTS